MHHGPCPSAGLAQLAGLELLLVGDNQLDGALPATWDAPLLQRLDLQSNAFTGEPGNSTPPSCLSSDNKQIRAWKAQGSRGAPALYRARRGGDPAWLLGWTTKKRAQ